VYEVRPQLLSGPSLASRPSRVAFFGPFPAARNNALLSGFDPAAFRIKPSSPEQNLYRCPSFTVVSPIS